MKNKSTMLLVGIGLAYLLYRLYAKKKNVAVIKNGIPVLLNEPEKMPEKFYPTDMLDNKYLVQANKIPNQFLVDNINTAELVDTPSTYQTLYAKTNVRMNGISTKVPATC